MNERKKKEKINLIKEYFSYNFFSFIGQVEEKDVTKVNQDIDIENKIYFELITSPKYNDFLKNNNDIAEKYKFFEKLKDELKKDK